MIPLLNTVKDRSQRKSSSENMSPLFTDYNADIAVLTLTGLLLVSVAFNIYCCVKVRARRGRRRRASTHMVEMKEMPIYGNVAYLTTDGEVMESSVSPSHSSSRTRNRLDTTACYAKLELKAPREAAGSKSSQDILYSDVMCLEKPRREPEKNNIPATSDLYATVSPQRCRVSAMTSESDANYAKQL